MKKIVLVSVGSLAMIAGAAIGLSAYSKLRKERLNEDAKITDDIMEE